MNIIEGIFVVAFWVIVIAVVLAIGFAIFSAIAPFILPAIAILLAGFFFAAILSK